jgi:mannose-1-phosphate guanylyltransferase
MAGGSGTRFWPKSKQSYPKQFLRLFGNQTMIQSTVSRLEPFITPGRCMVVTNKDYTDIVNEQLPSLGSIVGEPSAKNTAACVLAAAAMIHANDPDAVMVVLPADHHITDPTAFREVLAAAVETAQKNESLVTIGITPNRPETGYGYIRFNKESATEPANHKVYDVMNFTEKPELKVAESFLKSGDYLWNSGMFVWKTETILKAFSKYLPEMHESAVNSFMKKDSDIEEFYSSCQSVSIDYGIMEKAENVQVIPGDFGWNDVGSWTAVYELGEKDKNGNVVDVANASFQNSQNNFISSESGKIIALVGVENIAVVETETAILVCDLTKAQGVKDVVDHLKSDSSLNKYL